MYSGSNGTFDDGYIRYVLDNYSEPIVRLCFSYVRNMHDAEDIAQDTFCEIIKRKPVFTDENHEKAWLIRTAVNKCKNHLKSGWVSKTSSIDDNLSSPALGCEDSALDDTSRAVYDAVMELPEKYRTVIHMYYYMGLSIAEIAKANNIAAASAGTRLARGRALLKKKLGDDF